MNLSIRPLRTVAELRACEAMQRQVWAMPDDLEVVPAHLLVAVQRNGGLLLGAFDADRFVGFVFGFPAVTADGKLKHCSHMTAVVPSYQSKGIGLQLKLAQRQWVLDQGIDLITWTYDPLESRNAQLNIRKLGAVCRTYFRDYYGPLTDGLSAGLPSDRFQVEWWIDSDRAVRRLAGDSGGEVADSVAQVNTTARTREGLLTPAALTLNEESPRIQFEIPADFQGIKLAAPELALEWRLAVRSICEVYFAGGYTLVDHLYVCTAAGERSYYILQAD